MLTALKRRLRRHLLRDPDYAFLFEPPQDRAARGFLHEVVLRQGFAHVFGCRPTAFPQDVHDKLLKIA